MNILKLFLGLSFVLFISLSFSQSNWELRKEKNGIKVFTKSMPNVKLKASKAEMVANTSVDRILEVLKDIPNYTKWNSSTKSANLLKSVSASELYYYSVIKAPMVSDRDLVVHLKYTTQGNVTTVIMKGVPSYIPEKEGLVRMPSYYGKYILTDLKNGKTKIELEYSADPGGSLPDWLVNTAAVDVPFEIFTLLNERF